MKAVNEQQKMLNKSYVLILILFCLLKVLFGAASENFTVFIT